MLINPKINRDINSAKVHLWSKFGNPSFNWWWVSGMEKLKIGHILTFELKFTMKVKVNQHQKQ